MERKIKLLITVIFLFFSLGLFFSNSIYTDKTVKSTVNLKKQNRPRPNKPPIHNTKRYSVFFEGVPIIKGDKLENKDTLLKNGYILGIKHHSFSRLYNYEYTKNNGNKIKPENTNISLLFLSNSKLYFDVSIGNKKIALDENKIFYHRHEYIKIDKNESYQIIQSAIKVKVENLNTKDIKKLILNYSDFDLSDWTIDYNNSSFFNLNSARIYGNFYQDTDKDIRQSKFISFKKDSRYLFFFFRLDTEAFDSNKINKISLNEDVFESEDNSIKTNYQKYIATFSLLSEINEKRIDLEKAILKRFKRDDRQFLLVVYGDIFKIVQLEIGSLNKDFETFVELVELTTINDINLFKKDKIEFTLAEIKKTFEKFITNYHIDELELLNQLTKSNTHNETIELNFYTKNNSTKPILKTLKLKLKVAKEIDKLDLTFKTNNNYFIADDEKITSITSDELKKKTFRHSTTTLSGSETTLYTGFETDINSVIATIKGQLKNILNEKEYEIYSLEDKNGNYLFSIQKLSTSEVRVFKVKVRRISPVSDFYELNRLFMFDYYQIEHNIQEVLNYFNSKTNILKKLNLEILNYTELNSEINNLKVSPYAYKKLKLSLQDKYSNIYTVSFFAEIRYGDTAPVKISNSYVDSMHTRFFMSSNLAFSNATADLFGSYDLKNVNQNLRQWFDKESEDFALSELNKTFKVTYNFFKKDYLAMQTNLKTYLLYLNNSLDYSEQEMQSIFSNIFGKNITKIEKNQDNSYSIYLNDFREEYIIYLKHSSKLSKYRVSNEIIKERISQLFKTVLETNENAQKLVQTLENLLKTVPELKISKENTGNSNIILKIYSALNKEIYKTFTVV